MNLLATKYMGLSLKSPLVPSSSPLTCDVATIKRMEDLGAGAVVLLSLFEEQITHQAEKLSHFLESGSESYGEALDFFPIPNDFAFGPEEYLEHIRRTTESVDMPVIASLNAIDKGRWVDYAALLENAGAHAIELNVFFMATDPLEDAASVEARYIEVVRAVREAVTIPVAVKLGPYFSSFGHFARQLDEAHADALVLFNRFYQPDIDLEELEVVSDLHLSTPYEGRLVLRWLALLYGKLRAHLAATTGVHSATDALKMIAAGADVTMLCSVLLKKGVQEIEHLRNEMQHWLVEHQYESVSQLRGTMSLVSCPDPQSFARANYMKILQRYR